MEEHRGHLMNRVVLEQQAALVMGQIFLDVFVIHAFEFESPDDPSGERARPESEELHFSHGRMLWLLNSCFGGRNLI
ncbi:hypothetical protein GQ457_01G032880 [Hibiscus cannabinus]